MAIGDITWQAYQAALSSAILALSPGGSQDFISARIFVAQGKLTALALADKVAAAGTSVDLLVGELDKVLAMITEVEMRQAMKTTNGRLIKTGLASEGHRKGWDGGLLHP